MVRNKGTKSVLVRGTSLTVIDQENEKVQDKTNQRAQENVKEKGQEKKEKKEQKKRNDPVLETKRKEFSRSVGASKVFIKKKIQVGKSCL